jgi:hypothetical protein
VSDKERPNPDAIFRRPRPGATRCPYCHEECVASADACACGECLARHHPGCWDEGGGCGTCRGTLRMEVRPAAPLAVDQYGYGEVIEAWLRLGLVYNAGLTGVTVLCLGTSLFSFAIFEAAIGAVLANLCFLLGPAIELGARRVGHRAVWLRWALFVPGFCLALLLALVTCLTV